MKSLFIHAYDTRHIAPNLNLNLTLMKSLQIAFKYNVIRFYFIALTITETN